MMALYYTLALFKIKDSRVAAETQAIILRLVDQNQYRALSILYLSLKLKNEWKLGNFNAAVEIQKKLAEIEAIGELEKHRVAETYYYPALLQILKLDSAKQEEKAHDFELLKVHCEISGKL